MKNWIMNIKKPITLLLLVATAMMAHATDSLMTAVKRNLEAMPAVRDSYIKYGEQFSSKDI